MDITDIPEAELIQDLRDSAAGAEMYKLAVMCKLTAKPGDVPYPERIRVNKDVIKRIESELIRRALETKERRRSK